MSQTDTKKTKTTTKTTKTIKKNTRKVEEKVYSLLKPDQNNVSNQIAQNAKGSCIVCLKVPRHMFEELFGNKKHRSVKNTHTPSQDLSELIQNSDWLYTRLSVPDIYPETKLELKKETVVFKDYSHLDLGSINQYLNEQNISKKVNLILPSFEGGWPERSSYACWNCTEKFDTYPVGLPTLYENHKKVEYRLEGNFCGYSCAARYLFDRESGTDLWQRYDLLNVIYRQLCPDVSENIALAPPYLSLKKFGGQLSIEDYRNSQIKARSYQVYRYPLKPCPYYLEETKQVRKNQTYIPLENKKVKNIEQKYKLYRQKPLPTKSCSIDECMNIKYL